MRVHPDRSLPHLDAALPDISPIQAMLEHERRMRRKAAEVGDAAIEEFQRTLKDIVGELAATKAFLVNILDSSTEYSIIAQDLDRKILSWNAGAEHNYGYAADEVLGRSAEMLHASDELEEGRFRRLFDKALRDGKGEGRVARRRKDGSEFTAGVVVTRRDGPDGRPVGYLIVSRDVTEQERLDRLRMDLAAEERALRDARRAQSRFLANMSHELRTPLNSVVGFSQMLLDGAFGELTPKQREPMSDVAASARHLLEIINDVLDLSRIEAGRLEMNPDDVDLAETVREVRGILGHLSEAKGLQVEADVAEDARRVRLDPTRVRQVLFNYVANAFKFTPPGGRVEIRVVSEADDHVRIEVEDTGPGIREADVPRLFRQFQQLDDGPAKLYGGTGLGLAIVKRLVEAQGGRVGVDSRWGQGSTFFAVLPRTVTARTADQDVSALLEPEADVPTT